MTVPLDNPNFTALSQNQPNYSGNQLTNPINPPVQSRAVFQAARNSLTGGNSAAAGIGQLGRIHVIGPDDGNGNINQQNYDGDYSAIPGTAGIDYPVYGQVPLTNFDCGQQAFPGYYADVEAQCQVFHICALNRTYSFLCPNGTIFSQEVFVCVWWHQYDCLTSPTFYPNNAYIYDYGKIPTANPLNVVPEQQVSPINSRFLSTPSTTFAPFLHRTGATQFPLNNSRNNLPASGISNYSGFGLRRPTTTASTYSPIGGIDGRIPDSFSNRFPTTTTGSFPGAPLRTNAQNIFPGASAPAVSGSFVPDNRERYSGFSPGTDAGGFRQTALPFPAGAPSANSGYNLVRTQQIIQPNLAPTSGYTYPAPSTSAYHINQTMTSNRNREYLPPSGK